MATPSRLVETLSCGYDSATLFVALGYCLTSSLLSIINKFAVLHFPYPAALTGFQYLVSAVSVVILSALGWVEAVPFFDFALVKQMFPVLLTFYGSVYSNMKVLQHANVETFIVFRSITPLIVCVADAFFRPHVASLPSGRTALSLFTIFLGAAGYTALDSTFTATSYGWGALYVTIFCVEMVYGVGLVYYNNGIGALMSALVFVVFDESGAVGRSLTTPEAGAGAAVAAAPHAAHGRRRALLADLATPSAGAGAFTQMALTGIVVSCVFGLGISFFGFSVRRKISATGFTVLGCTNKIATLVVNTLAWDKHASVGGQLCLVVCILGGVAYGELAKADAEAKKRKALPPSAPPPDEA